MTQFECLLKSMRRRCLFLTAIGCISQMGSTHNAPTLSFLLPLTLFVNMAAHSCLIRAFSWRWSNPSWSILDKTLHPNPLFVSFFPLPIHVDWVLCWLLIASGALMTCNDGSSWWCYIHLNASPALCSNDSTWYALTTLLVTPQSSIHQIQDRSYLKKKQKHCFSNIYLRCICNLLDIVNKKHCQQIVSRHCRWSVHHNAYQCISTPSLKPLLCFLSLFFFFNQNNFMCFHLPSLFVCFFSL